MEFRNNMKFGIEKQRLCDVLKVNYRAWVWVLYDLRDGKKYVGNFKTKKLAIEQIKIQQKGGL